MLTIVKISNRYRNLIHLAALDPDPYWECRSESKSMESDLNLLPLKRLLYLSRYILDLFSAVRDSSGYVFLLIPSYVGYTQRIFYFCHVVSIFTEKGQDLAHLEH